MHQENPVDLAPDEPSRPCFLCCCFVLPAGLRFLLDPDPALFPSSGKPSGRLAWELEAGRGALCSITCPSRLGVAFTSCSFDIIRGNAGFTFQGRRVVDREFWARLQSQSTGHPSVAAWTKARGFNVGYTDPAAGEATPDPWQTGRWPARSVPTAVSRAGGRRDGARGNVRVGQD